MKKIRTKVLAYVLAVIMCLSAVNVPVYAQESTVTEISTEAEATREVVTDKTTPRLIQFHTFKNAVKPPFLGDFFISGISAA